jgi:hypothetical protein
VTAAVTPAALTRELLAWVRAAPRSYADVVDAWVTNCPRHPVWDEARASGLLSVVDGRVVLTPGGEAVLGEEAA